MNSKRTTACWGIIFWLILGLGCSTAPLPTEGNTDNAELEKGFSKIIISSTDYEGQIVDSAKVFWDGDFAGYTPFTKENVDAGIHSLRIQKNGFELYTESITINPSQSVYIEALLKKLSLNKGQLFITVDQNSVVTVLSNDKSDIIDLFYVREKNYVLDPGGYFLRAERPGYRLFLTAIEIQVDSIVIQNIRMEKLKSYELPDVVLALPDSGTVDQPLVVSWESNNAQRIDIDYIENPGLSGKREVVFQLAGKKYIKAIAYNNAGSRSVIDSVYISNPVDDPNVPPVIELSVYPKNIKISESATIKWQSSNAISVSVDYVSNPGLDGAWQINFDTSGVYKIEAHAYGPGGTAVDYDTLVVEDEENPILDPPLINVFSVTPDSILKGESAVLHWDVSGENVKVILDQGIGEVGKTGNQNVSPDVSANYTIIVTNSAGAVSRSVQLRVGTKSDSKVNPPSLNFSVTPGAVEYGKPISVSWSSDGYQVIIDQGIGVRGPSGTEEVYFENPGLKIFTAIAYGEAQTITTKTDSVFVNEPEQPESPIIFLSVVDSVEVGKPAQIEWHSQNTDRVDVDYVQLAGLNGKAEVIFYSEGRREITATAYNQAGQVTAFETIEVVSSTIQKQVSPIYISSMAMVAAFHNSCPQVVENAGQAEIVHEGFYQVTAKVWYNSADYQKNESFFIAMKDENGNFYYPQEPNAGFYKVVPDDPGAPHVKERDAGLFYLRTGAITIELHHYYTISQMYPQFIVDGPIDSAESVQVLSFQLEFIQP